MKNEFEPGGPALRLNIEVMKRAFFRGRSETEPPSPRSKGTINFTPVCLRSCPPVCHLPRFLLRELQRETHRTTVDQSLNDQLGLRSPSKPVIKLLLVCFICRFFLLVVFLYECAILVILSQRVARQEGFLFQICDQWSIYT